MMDSAIHSERQENMPVSTLCQLGELVLESFCGNSHELAQAIKINPTSLAVYSSFQ